MSSIKTSSARLLQDRLHAFHIIARESPARCDYESALEVSEAALGHGPLYERGRFGLLMQAEREQASNAAALQTFEKYRAKPKHDLGLVSSEGIRRLFADISSQPSSERRRDI